MEDSVLHRHLNFIVGSYKLRKEYDADEERKLRKKWDSKEHQLGTPYTKWLRYLKNRRLYSTYVKDLKAILATTLERGYLSQFATQVAFFPYTMNQIKEVVEHMDNCIPKYWKHYWRIVFDEFEAEDSLEARKKLLANRLYHMDAPNVTHHLFVKREKPKKHLIDDIIDKILFIKRK